MKDHEYVDYVEIEYASSTDIEYPNKVYTDSLPDTFISNNPLELQEAYISSQGKGYRNSYSYRPTVSINFNTKTNTNYPFLPLQSKLHKHDYFDFMVIASDQCEMQIESHLCEFKKWDVCILNRSTRHSEHFKPETKIFYLVLQPEYLLNWPQEEGVSLQHSLVFTKFFNKGLRDTLQQNKDFIVSRYISQARISPIEEIIENIRREFENKRPGYQLFIRGLTYQLFSLLADPKHYNTEYINLGSDEGFSLAFSAKQILDKNKRRMTKAQLAERLSYNSEYINRVFKKHYGYTIPEYNRLICMRQAASMLCDTNQRIHDICKQLGFKNRTHFYNLFKHEYDCTPYDYRKNRAKR